jgi:uncharacterized lipoprotein YmbA
MRYLLILTVLLAGCSTFNQAYKGILTTPDGKEYKVEQSTAGSIKIKDGDVEIEADTKQPSLIQKLLDYRMLKEAQK